MMVFGKLEKNLKWLLYLSLVAIVLLPNDLFAEYIAVKVPIANIRSGPGQTKDVLWKIEAYHPLHVIEKKEKWYHFKDFEGDEGWIHGSLVQKMSTVITKKEDCNVRSEPNTKSDIVFTTEKGIPFKVLKTKGKWLNIEHADGDRGWIHQSLVWPNK